MIEIKHLSKSFQMKDGAVQALKDINLTIPDGSIYGIIGMSGAGKSTLVRCINLLERPTEGSVVIDGTAMETLSPAALRQRRREITMIFQQFNLLMQRSCLKNICFPMELAGVKKAEAEQRARELLQTVGLPDKAEAYPAQLSGGQKQRIAIARALATNPKVLLCDEATSALDPNTTQSILTLIRDINRKLGITVVVITHQMSVVEAICDRVAILDKGVVVEEGSVKEIFANPKTAAARRLVAPNGGAAARVANTLNISFEYIEGESVLYHLSDLGICASSGSACAAGSLEPSHVIRAMGVPFTAVHGSIRFSLSRYTTEEEIDYVLRHCPGVVAEMRAISPFVRH